MNLNLNLRLIILKKLPLNMRALNLKNFPPNDAVNTKRHYSTAIQKMKYLYFIYHENKLIREYTLSK